MYQKKLVLTYYLLMEIIKMPSEILAENMLALRDNGNAGKTQAEIAKASGLSQKKISRIIRNEQETGIDTLAKLAMGFGLQAWQLLVENLDPKNPPVLVPISEKELLLYKKLLETAKLFEKTK
jgi:transcriptional regulator with XRE-family HTH domain